MTDPRPLDPTRPLGPGRTIIEASAGTGKTYTIAGYVTRLVAEEGIPIDRILVVTFTRAATAELRDRIRKRIVGTLRSLTGSSPVRDGDEHLVASAADPQMRAAMVRRLSDALVAFDRAAVFTIHGFTLRLLGGLGFHAGISDELEPGDVEPSLIRETAADLIVSRFADDADGAVTRKELTAVGRAVTVNPDATIVPPPETGGPAGLRSELAHAMRSEVDRRLRERGAAAYDRFLIEARDALIDPDVGEDARRILRARYAVALVDEAQDTDPIQWQIIRSVFDDRRLVVIGDPKQSIYSFRGADVEAYLSAVEGADERLTLATNWRSDGPLVDALDALFDGVTFGDDRIAYRKVRAVDEHTAARMHGPGAPLTIRRFSPDAPIKKIRNGKFSKPAAREAVAADVADGVVRYLGSDQTITGADGEERALHPGDVAVLCRTRNQVNLVRAELDRRGVPSVAARSGTVLTSDAAGEWLRFLNGIERPSRDAAVRLAASTLLVGMPLADVAALDDDALLDLRLEMRRLNDVLRDAGVPALVADLDRTTGLAARVLGRPDGERTMTDLLHLAEMMHTARRRGGIGSLAAWLETQMVEAAADERDRADTPESRQRRLETDAKAVQVQTIHAAKGLEYPVVLVPFLWDKPALPRDAVVVPVFHDPDDARPEGEPRRRFVDVGVSVSPDYDRHVALAGAEGAAEESRLLYVALTRAEHRLVVWWIDHASGADETNLHRILTRGGVGDGSADLTWLLDRADGTVRETWLHATPGTSRYEAPEEPDRRPLQIATFDRTVDRTWRRVSFTSLSPDHSVTTVGDRAEGEVRDDEIELADAAPDAPDAAVPDAADGTLPLAAMPRGAAFGTLVHNVLEHVPFDDGHLEAALRTGIRRSAGSGWEPDRDTLAAGLAAALTTPLGPADTDPSLADVPDRRTLKEMRFEFPVRTGDEPWSVAGIADAMARHLPGSDPRRRYAERLAAEHADPFRGSLVGAIDYTAIVPGPDGGDRYVVMDYKTNTLPALGDAPAPADYRGGALADAMEHSHYLLQALLYQVALHRYLQWRLPGYDPQRHLGGARYLFLRGMIGPETPVVDGERCGVYRWEPPAELIVDLSRRFAGEEQG